MNSNSHILRTVWRESRRRIQRYTQQNSEEILGACQGNYGDNSKRCFAENLESMEENSDEIIIRILMIFLGVVQANFQKLRNAEECPYDIYKRIPLQFWPELLGNSAKNFFLAKLFVYELASIVRKNSWKHQRWRRILEGILEQFLLFLGPCLP